MKKNVFHLSLAAAALIAGTALAGGAGAPLPAALPHTYQCDGGQTVGVRYVQSDDIGFVVVRYQGQNYGLAPAVSASGSRFVGLDGQSTATGLEWWEHQGEGTLSSYDPLTGDTATLATGCRLR